jgi:predicted membrane metal-binding protein
MSRKEYFLGFGKVYLSMFLAAGLLYLIRPFLRDVYQIKSTSILWIAVITIVLWFAIWISGRKFFRTLRKDAVEHKKRDAEKKE